MRVQRILTYAAAGVVVVAAIPVAGLGLAAIKAAWPVVPLGLGVIGTGVLFNSGNRVISNKPQKSDGQN